MANIPNPQLAQIAMCVADIPRALRFYNEVFGFVSSGGRAIWGERLARIQGLGDDAQCIVWWMVGRQEFVQLEFFNHTLPAQQPLPTDWRPCDLGWVRWGVAVDDFDGVLARLAERHVELLGPVLHHDGLRRACFQDPDGTVVEVLEEGVGIPGGVRPAHHPFAPAVVYAAISVSDIEASRAFFIDTLGLAPAPGVLLHTREMEALWGLDGAERDSFVARAGDAFLEVVQYRQPAPAPKPDVYLPSDQGFLNAAFAFRERDLFDQMYERVLDARYRPNLTVAPGSGFASTYINDGQANTVEIFGCPPEFEAQLGFVPEGALGRRPST